MTGTSHHTQLFYWLRWGRADFLSRLPLNCCPPNVKLSSRCWVVGMSYHVRQRAVLPGVCGPVMHTQQKHGSGPIFYRLMWTASYSYSCGRCTTPALQWGEDWAPCPRLGPDQRQHLSWAMVPSLWALHFLMEPGWTRMPQTFKTGFREGSPIEACVTRGRYHRWAGPNHWVSQSQKWKKKCFEELRKKLLP
jgi:hypothetical protein